MPKSKVKKGSENLNQRCMLIALSNLSVFSFWVCMLIPMRLHVVKKVSCVFISMNQLGGFRNSLCLRVCAYVRVYVREIYVYVDCCKPSLVYLGT